MKGTQRDLATWLTASPFPPLWAVTGEEPLLIEEAAEAIRAAAQRHGFTQRERAVIDKGQSLRALAIATESFSLFAERRLLELRWQSLPASKEEAAWLSALTDRPPAETVTLLILPPLDWRERKSAWYQRLAERAHLVETVAPTRAQLPQWWAERLAQQGQRASSTLLAWLATCTEGNLLAAKQQLALLALLFPPGELPEEAVRQTVGEVARFDPFDLRLAVLTRNNARALRIIARLREEGVAEPLVLWAISAALRALARASHLSSCTPQALEALARDERLFAPLEKRALREATALPAQTTRAWLMAAARLDAIAKGAEVGHFWEAAERLLFALTQPVPLLGVIR